MTKMLAVMEPLVSYGFCDDEVSNITEVLVGIIGSAKDKLASSMINLSLKSYYLSSTRY